MCGRLAESHGQEICFWSAISPASETRGKFFFQPERPTDGVEKKLLSPTVTVETLLFLGNWVSLVSLPEATGLEKA